MDNNVLHCFQKKTKTTTKHDKNIAEVCYWAVVRESRHFHHPASGIAAPQCGNYDDALVVAKSEVGRSIMAAIPTTSGMVISVGI
ncbi:MAG: hypothetical protein WCR46_26350 [Deltaproteobacteria bacterium]|jgi:hypothetical protein